MNIIDLTLDNFINISDLDIEKANIVTVDGIEVKNTYFTIDKTRSLKLFEIKSHHDIIKDLNLFGSNEKLKEYIISKIKNIGILKTKLCLRPDIIKRKDDKVYTEMDNKSGNVLYYQIEWEHNNQTYFQIIWADGVEEWRKCI